MGENPRIAILVERIKNNIEKIAKTYRKLGKRAEDALEQIREKSYARELEDDGYESVVCYGISFFGKDCEVCIATD